MTRRAVPTIDRLESDGKDPRWAKVFLEGSTRAVARLPRESLTELRVREGAAWTAALARRVREFVTHRDAREFAMGVLARSSHNAATISARLTRKGFDDAVVSRTVSELKTDGWLNDDVHAAIRAESVTRQRRGLSQESLEILLEAEGIDAPRAARESRRVAGSAHAMREALALARRAIAKRGKRTAYAVATNLARRGMDTEVVSQALRAEGWDLEE